MLLNPTWTLSTAAAVLLVACAHQEVKPTQSSVEPIAKAEPAPEAPPAAPPVEAPALAVAPALTPIHFDFDASVILQDDESVLVAIAAYLPKALDVSLTIGGYCDERGTVEYNIALGDRRAGVARDYLVHRGIDAARIKTISYGETKPIDPGHNEDAWAKNRRDEFQFEEGKRAQK